MADVIRDRVLLVLCAAGLFACFALAFVTHAPNRLVSGQPVSLLDAAAGGRDAGASAGPRFCSPRRFCRSSRAAHAAMAVAAASLLVALWWLAGAHAAVLAETAPPRSAHIARRRVLGAGRLRGAGR